MDDLRLTDDYEQGEEIAEIHVYKNSQGRWELWIENVQYPDRNFEEVMALIRFQLIKSTSKKGK